MANIGILIVLFLFLHPVYALTTSSAATVMVNCHQPAKATCHVLFHCRPGVEASLMCEHTVVDKGRVNSGIIGAKLKHESPQVALVCVCVYLPPSTTSQNF